MAFTRSTTGCFACKTKRKKCDETKPQCLRCQKSRTECPGYIYIKDPNNSGRKLRTLQAPRTRVGRPRDSTYPGTSLVFSETEGPLLCDVISPASYNVSDTFVVGNVGISEAAHISNMWASSSSFNTIDNYTAIPTQNLSVAKPLTTGQASLLEALFSLGQPSDINSPPQRLQLPTSLLPDPRTHLISGWSTHITERQDDVATHDDEVPEGAVGIIRRQPVLDKTLESNASSFVLQSYATWIQRLALEPVQMMRIARNVVLSLFEGGEHSRWTIVLLANIGSRIGSMEFVEARPYSLVSMLQKAVRQKIGAVMSHPNPERPALARALDSVVETMSIHFFVSSMSEVIVLIQEAAPVFRQLCPDPSDVAINLPSLLQHRLDCLGHYAGIDLTLSLLVDIPTQFQYEVAIPSSQPFSSSQLVPAIQDDGSIQWLNGIPTQLLLVFSKMISMRSDEFIPSAEKIASCERDIHEVRSYSSSSSERFLAIMRLVVQECWKQAAYVYLYMAVCGDSANTLRVKEALKRVMRLLNETKPGRLPDEFIIVPLILIAPAAQHRIDREVIRHRILGLHMHGRQFRGNSLIIHIIEDYWARTDAEGRPTMWSDVAVSRRRVSGV